MAQLGHGFHDDIQIHIGGGDAKHARAAHGVERLHDHVLVFGNEGVNQRRLTGHQRRRHELWKFGDGQLLVVIANRRGLVQNMRALRFGQLQ